METFKNARDFACAELARLASERERIDLRIEQLKQIVQALGPVIESEAVALDAAKLAASTDTEPEGGVVILSAGMTDSIKQVYVLASTPLTPVEVREQLVNRGLDLTKYSNPLATIHSVIKRLVEQDWLEPVEKDGKRAYEKVKRTTSAMINTSALMSQFQMPDMKTMFAALQMPSIKAAYDALTAEAQRTNVAMNAILRQASEQTNAQKAQINEAFGAMTNPLKEVAEGLRMFGNPPRLTEGPKEKD